MYLLYNIERFFEKDGNPRFVFQQRPVDVEETKRHGAIM